MYRFLFALTVLFLIEHTNAYCCFRDTWTLTPKCGCSNYYDPPCCVSNSPNIGSYACGCGQTPSANIGCNLCGQPVYVSSSFCDCGIAACPNYRDTCNVCVVPDNPSSVCACLKTLNDFDCGCDELRSYIYFPEVEYPMTVLEMKPFYYADCWCY